MPFLTGSVSLSRYRIPGGAPKGLHAEIPERLKKYAFQDIDQTAEERSFGWVCFEDYLDPAWTEAPPEKGAYMAFSLRLDTRRVQPAVFKKHFQIAVRDYLNSITDKEKRFISKDRKQEIREQVALRLRARALPVPAVFEVVWNLENDEIWLASTNKKVRELFEDHFAATFEIEPEPLTPFYLASRMLGEDKVSRLENLEPSNFADPDLARAAQSIRPLGDDDADGESVLAGRI